MSTVRFTGEVLPDGTIRLPPHVRLAPGRAEVTVEQPEDTEKCAVEAGHVPQVARDLAELAASLDATGIPDDLAENHDHYLHGSAKGIDAAPGTDPL